VKKTACLAIWIVVALLPLAVVADSDKHDFGDVEHWKPIFEATDRYKWQQTGMVLRLLAFREGDRVADLGAGTGYFTVLLADLVGKQGECYGVEVEPALIEHLKQREELREKANFFPVLAELDDPKLPENGLDLILVVNTWHHIDERGDYQKHLAAALVDGGRLVIVDWRKGALAMGPPDEHRVSRDQVVRELHGKGWKLQTESVALDHQYYLIFTPPLG
jgi:SAM-dependent methyltransferase